MSTRYYNVCSERKQNDTLEAKNTFHKIGVLKVTPNGGHYLHLYQYPETNFRIFPNTEEDLPVIE